MKQLNKKVAWRCASYKKLCWDYFAFNQSYLLKGKIAPVVLLPHDAKKIHDFTLADQDWIGLMIFKTFADQDWIEFNFIRSGLDSD